MPAGDIFEMNVDMTFDNQEITNVLHFVQIGADGSGDARNAVREIYVTDYQLAFQNMISSDVTIVAYRVRRLLPTQTQSLSVSVSVPGLVLGDPLPTNQVAVLRLYGTLTGRKGVGNVRCPGVDNVFVNEGRVNTSYAALAQLFGDAFERDNTDSISAYVMRSVVLGTDNIGRQVQVTRMTSRIKQLRSRTIGQGQ